MFSPSLVTLFSISTISASGFLFLFLDPIFFSQNILLKISTFIKDFCYSSDVELVATIYNATNINITIFIVFYLLLTLIVVVKVTGNFFGPLRLSSN